MPKQTGKKRSVTVQLVLQILVILVMVVQFLHQNYYNVFLCLLTLLLFNIPLIVDRRFNIKLPMALQVIILLFIFSAEILGEIRSFYTIFPYWDSMLHTMNGFLMAAIGFSLIDILNQDPRFHISMSPLFVAFVAFCFSMTVGVIWEFFEFAMDCFAHTDMQKDFFVPMISSVAINPSGLNDVVHLPDITSTVVNYVEDGVAKSYTMDGGYLDIGIKDTMKDLLVNCLGAVVFSVIGIFYIKNRGEGKVAKSLIPQLKTEAEIEAARLELEEQKEMIRRKKQERKENRKQK